MWLLEMTYHAALNAHGVCGDGANFSGLSAQRLNAHIPPTQSIQLQARKQSVGHVRKHKRFQLCV